VVSQGSHKLPRNSPRVVPIQQLWRQPTGHFARTPLGARTLDPTFAAYNVDGLGSPRTARGNNIIPLLPQPGMFSKMSKVY